MSNGDAPSKVLVCDDHEDDGELVASALENIEGIEVMRLFGKLRPDEKEGAPSLEKAVELLNQREAEILEGNKAPPASPFDDADIVFVDYRLEELGPFHPTGENIIGSIRAFAAAKYIVSFNVHRDVDFDLQDLFGARESRADLAISANNVTEPALWGGGAGKDGFHPSYWPVLLDAAHRRVEQIKWVESKLAERVLESLGFDDVRKDRLFAGALSSLFPRQVVENVSMLDYFELFSTAAEDLTIKQIEEISKGGRDGGKPHFREIVCRMCAYKIERWLRLHLLAPQDVLVDLPHLVQRAPHVLGPDRLNDIGAWNQTAGIKTWEDAVKLIDPKFAELIEKAIFDGWEIWFGHPVFWWADLMENDEIVWPDLGEGITFPDFVFCEDLTDFIDDGKYRAFQINQPSAHRTRYVRELKGKAYAPVSQFALIEE